MNIKVLKLKEKLATFILIKMHLKKLVRKNIVFFGGNQLNGVPPVGVENEIKPKMS